MVKVASSGSRSRDGNREEANRFKGPPFEGEIMMRCVCWYLRDSLSGRDLEERMTERGLKGDHTTRYRWVKDNAPELETRVKLPLKPTQDVWRVDETSMKVKGEWGYLYRAVESDGNTLDFRLSAQCDTEATYR